MADLNYYKIIVDNQFVGVGTSWSMVKYQEKHNILIVCTEEDGQYIMYDEDLYRDNWMRPTESDIDYTPAEVKTIDKDTYYALLAAIQSNEEIIEESEEIIQPVPTEDNDAAFEYIRDSKISEVQCGCKSQLEESFEVVLSDGEAHSFSFTTDEYTTFVSLYAYAVLSNNASYITWYDEELGEQDFSIKDFSLIYYCTLTLRERYLSYCNNLIAYINDLEDINSISAVSYGMELPEQYSISNSALWKE